MCVTQHCKSLLCVCVCTWSVHVVSGWAYTVLGQQLNVNFHFRMLWQISEAGEVKSQPFKGSSCWAVQRKLLFPSVRCMHAFVKRLFKGIHVSLEGSEGNVPQLLVLRFPARVVTLSKNPLSLPSSLSLSVCAGPTFCCHFRWQDQPCDLVAAMFSFLIPFLLSDLPFGSSRCLATSTTLLLLVAMFRNRETDMASVGMC